MKKLLILIIISIGILSFSYNVIKAETISERLGGKILLQVENNGEAWYVKPSDGKRIYMADGDAAYNMMRDLGLGISNNDLAKIPIGIEDRFECLDTDNDNLCDKLEEGLGTDPYNSDSDGDGYNDGLEVRNDYNYLGIEELTYDYNLANNLKGKILLQVESRGEAWYIYPDDGKRYYMTDGDAAYQIMRYLSVGISNIDLEEIVIEGDDMEGDDMEGDDMEGDDMEGDDMEGDDMEEITGCTDPEAFNYNCSTGEISIDCNDNVNIDDGTCTYKPESFEFNQSTFQAFYLVTEADINGISLEEGVDWIGVFNGDICVGSWPWAGEYTTLPSMGDDGYEYSISYLHRDEIPTFKIYDGSSNIIYNAEASTDFMWSINGLYNLDYISVFEEEEEEEMEGDDMEGDDMEGDDMEGDEIICTENWGCSNWGDCLDGQRIKTCIDLNACGTIDNKPNEEQNCSITESCTEDWSCSNWSDCVDGEQTKICTDLNSCGTIYYKPNEEKNCSTEE